MVGKRVKKDFHKKNQCGEENEERLIRKSMMRKRAKRWNFIVNKVFAMEIKIYDGNGGLILEK